MVLQFLGEIPPENYFDLQQIGSGSYSSIFSATHTRTNSRVALKISLKTNDTEKMKIIYHELKIHKTLNHPLICKYFADFETEHLLVISMELIEGACLLDHVNRSRGLKIQDAQNFFSQIVIAVEYLHFEKNISHRDLKLENVMVDNYNLIRLIDFGFSSPKIIMSTLCGSIPYCAPEVLKGHDYTKEADIWCLGIILYSIITGKLPFYHSNIKQMMKLICEQEPDYSIIYDMNLQNLISKLLVKDPCQRITIDEIKCHIFMSHARFFKIDYKNLFSTNSVSTIKSNTINPINPSSSQRNVNNLTGSINLDLVYQNRDKSLNSFNKLRINNLQQLITTDTNNIDDLITSRKDYSLNLNKLIESAFAELSPGNVKMIGSYINFKAGFPSNFKSRPIRFHRFSHNNVIFQKSPLIAKPF